MITTKDQEDLLRLISQYLEREVTCVAIGGTAMIFHGYKNATKDIDLVFRSTEDRAAFIDAIRELGYREASVKGVYDARRQADPAVPLMFSRGDERFDLFVRSVFGFLIPDNPPLAQRHDFPQQLTVLVLPKEFLIILKAVTNREKDYEDIVTIVRTEKDLDWSQVTAIAKEHVKENRWLIVDIEAKLQRLKEVAFIPEKHFAELYVAQEEIIQKERDHKGPVGKKTKNGKQEDRRQIP